MITVKEKCLILICYTHSQWLIRMSHEKRTMSEDNRIEFIFVFIQVKLTLSHFLTGIATE